MTSVSVMTAFATTVLGLALAYPRTAPAGISQSEGLARMVDDARQYGPRAAFVFDLDETTVDSSPRKYFSLLDAIHEACDSGTSPNPDCASLRDLKLSDLYRLRNRYDIATYLRSYGARDEAFMAALNQRAFGIYLSGRYIVEEDRLYVGAKAFLQELKRSGAQVYYVSARSTTTQAEPTLRFLVAHGVLRAGEENMVYLKPDSETSIDFKHRATAEIQARVVNGGGRVFGIFENEPENLAIWIQNIPRAMAFFMLGAYQNDGPVATKAVILEDFRY